MSGNLTLLAKWAKTRWGMESLERHRCEKNITCLKPAFQFQEAKPFSFQYNTTTYPVCATRHASSPTTTHREMTDSQFHTGGNLCPLSLETPGPSTASFRELGDEKISSL